MPAPNLLIKRFKSIGGCDWKRDTPDFECYLKLARFGHSGRYLERTLGGTGTWEERGLMNPGEALVQGVSRLFTPVEFSMNTWSEDILYSLTNERETILAGASSCGKSHVTGLFAYLWWMIAPTSTTCFMGSTSVKDLKRRTFSSVVNYHAIVKKKGGPGIFSKQLTAIVNESDSKEGVSADDVACGVLGLAFFGSASPEDQASRIGGTHQSTTKGAPNAGEGSVVVILDEMQALPAEAISRALINLASGVDLMRICGSGNFNTRTDMLGERAEPKDGWSSVTIDYDHEWTTTRGGKLIRLDALRSPAVVEEDGEKKYPFLPNREHIANQLAEVKGNENDPAYWSMTRAWPREEDDISIVFPAVLQAKYKVRLPVEWGHNSGDIQTVLALDPSFGGADKAAMCALDVGIFADGRRGMAVREITYMTIDGKSPRPVQYQLSDQFRRKAQELNIPMSHCGLDESATQLVGDVITMESGEPGLVRINFAARPTDNLVSVHSMVKAADRWGNLVTEMYLRLVEYGSFGQLRNVPAEASRQLAIRQTLPDRQPLRLERKKDHKKRLGRSPDDADVLAMACYLAMIVLGLMPGATKVNPGGGVQFDNGGRRRTRSVDYEECSYSSFELS